MADKPPLVVAVERALDGPARWVRYTPGQVAAARPADETRSRSPFAPSQTELVPEAVAAEPATDLADDPSEMPPLVAAVEDAIGSIVETLRYLPSVITVDESALAPPEIAAPTAFPERTAVDDDALVAAVEAAVAEGVLWLQYAPTVGEMRLISRRVA